MAAHSYCLAHPAVQTLDSIGCVDDFSHLDGVGKERHDLFPLAPPGRGNGGITIAPWSSGECLKLPNCLFRIGGTVDRLQRRGDLASFLPGGERQGMADQMHNESLD